MNGLQWTQYFGLDHPIDQNISLQSLKPPRQISFADSLLDESISAIPASYLGLKMRYRCLKPAIPGAY